MNPVIADQSKRTRYGFVVTAGKHFLVVAEDTWFWSGNPQLATVFLAEADASEAMERAPHTPWVKFVAQKVWIE